MSLIEFLRESFRGLHGRLDAALSELTDEQIHYRPEGKGNHIAFNIWHFVRTEDDIVQIVVQGKRSIWAEGEFGQKLGLEIKSQGTGMSANEAGDIHLPSLSEFLAYQKQVWEATDAYLASIGDAQLDEIRNWGRRGEVPVRQLVGSVVLTHGFGHLGEIQYIRGLQGL